MPGAARRGGAGFVDGDGVFEFDVDGFGVADEDGDADTGGNDLNGRVEDFFGLDGHFPFFLGGAVIHEDVRFAG